MSTGTRGPYAKTAQVRERILDASTEVFAQSGYRATTVKEIAQRAGLSDRGLGHHFASKDDLLAAVLDRRENRAAEQIAYARGLEALLATIEIVEEDNLQPGIVELHTLMSAEAANPEHPAHEHYYDRYEQFRLYTVHAFEMLKQQGKLDSTLSPEQLGAAYVAMMDGLQLQWLYNRDAIETTAVLRAFIASVVPSARGGDTSTP